MNKTLAVYVNDDYLLAAVRPLKDKYTILGENDDKRFAFYFRINQIDHSIDYGMTYKNGFLDNDVNCVGNFLNSISDSNKKYVVGQIVGNYIDLLKPILDRIREFYFRELKKYDSTELDENEVIETKIAFCDNIDQTSKECFISFWERNKFKIVETCSLDVMLASYFVSKKGLYLVNRKIAIVETLGNDMNMYIVCVDGKKFERQLYKKFKGYGIDPRVQYVAKKIVDDANRQENMLATREDVEHEYIRHYSKAGKVLEYFAKTQKKFMPIKTAFAVNISHKITINLSYDDITQQSYCISHQYASFFTDYFLNPNKLRVLDLEYIILVGQTMENETIKKEFCGFGNNKIEIMPNINVALTEMFNQTVESASNQNNKDNPLLTLDITTLHENQVVRLENFDPTPGKGVATQEFEFLGNGVFKVLRSTRSLLPGDIAKAQTNLWSVGLQVLLEITRNGRIIGLFKTRPVKEIYVSGGNQSSEQSIDEDATMFLK